MSSLAILVSSIKDLYVLPHARFHEQLLIPFDEDVVVFSVAAIASAVACDISLKMITDRFIASRLVNQYELRSASGEKDGPAFQCKMFISWA